MFILHPLYLVLCVKAFDNPQIFPVSAGFHGVRLQTRLQGSLLLFMVIWSFRGFSNRLFFSLYKTLRGYFESVWALFVYFFLFYLIHSVSLELFWVSFSCFLVSLLSYVLAFSVGLNHSSWASFILWALHWSSRIWSSLCLCCLFGAVQCISKEFIVSFCGLLVLFCSQQLCSLYKTFSE